MIPKWKLGHKSAIMVYRLTDDGDVWINAEKGLRRINAVEHLSAEDAKKCAVCISNAIDWLEEPQNDISSKCMNALRAYAKELERADMLLDGL